ncbi:MAG TPA: cysteine dioxygenase family protein [Elusimicrobiota bacterium]|jgi:predicted metal-dependent enzyme (double-stranded beta helix superfamily)|nr:cysteine dioxygenase family protein [Elusimicrobiota bacterium]
MPIPASPATRELIGRLDEAVSRPRVEAVCDGVKTALTEMIGSGAAVIPEDMLRPSTERYARRLLHMDPQERYSAVVMVWGPGQGTPLHDHAGQWCVEGVYRGRIKVTTYDLESRPAAGGPWRFKKAGVVLAGKSESGALIPPYEYHTIENTDSAPSVTLHIYRGEMKAFNAFVPVDGGYAPQRRETYYTP